MLAVGSRCSSGQMIFCCGHFGTCLKDTGCWCATDRLGTATPKPPSVPPCLHRLRVVWGDGQTSSPRSGSSFETSCAWQRDTGCREDLQINPEHLFQQPTPGLMRMLNFGEYFNDLVCGLQKRSSHRQIHVLLPASPCALTLFFSAPEAITTLVKFWRAVGVAGFHSR